MENLENYCQHYIHKNREKWFEGEMELHDIENYFTSPLKLFKSGKYYLARTNITTVLGKPSLKIYDENEKEVDFENIGDDTNVMTILEIQGIKCSAKSFQIEIELKQMMVLQSTNIFEKCVITPSRSKVTLSTEPSEVGAVPKDETADTLPASDVLEDQIRVKPEEENVTDNTIVFKTDDEGDTAQGLIMDNSVDGETEVKDDIVIDIPKEPSEDPLIEEEKILEADPLGGLEEVEFHLEELTDPEPLVIKKRDNVYYEMYKEARKKAKIARDLALSAYLEAKRIKNTYMLEDLVDEDSDDDDDSDDEDSDDEDSDEESDEDIEDDIEENKD
jgi:hypothetical protein